jgi:hypothetical protein
VVFIFAPFRQSLCVIVSLLCRHRHSATSNLGFTSHSKDKAIEVDGFEVILDGPGFDFLLCWFL